MEAEQVEHLTFTITTVGTIVVYTALLVGVYYKMLGKIKVMDMEVSSARKEIQDSNVQLEKENERLEKTAEENKAMLNGRIDASNKTINGINKEVGKKIDGLQKEVHCLSIEQEKNKNEILTAIRDSK